MTYLIEYLGEFEFIFETVLGYVSGDQLGTFKMALCRSVLENGLYRVGKLWKVNVSVTECIADC